MLKKGVHDAREWAVGFMGSLNLAGRYVFAGFSREKSGLCVGIGTIVLVVGFLTVLQATVSQSSLIFLKLAEDSVGENDIVRGVSLLVCGSFSASFLHFQVMLVDPTNDNPIPLVNYTDVARILAPNDEIEGVVPRWFLIADVINPTDTRRNTTVAVLVIDTELEKQAKLGSDWTRRPLGANEAYIVRWPSLRVSPQRWFISLLRDHSRIPHLLKLELLRVWATTPSCSCH